MTLKAKDVWKFTKDEALKKLGELERSLLELELASPKRKSVRKAIARVKTYIHIQGAGKKGKTNKAPALKTEKPKAETEKPKQ